MQGLADFSYVICNAWKGRGRPVFPVRTFLYVYGKAGLQVLQGRAREKERLRIPDDSVRLCEKNSGSS
jgi:hypothetical protein